MTTEPDPEPVNIDQAGDPDWLHHRNNDPRLPNAFDADDTREALQQLRDATDNLERTVTEALAGTARFVDTLAAAGIHVGIGNPPTCATCRKPWPCPGQMDRTTP